ncbi:IPT/TIG domain-containing protein, partial [Candidatus Uhrbacteria bacterium]|nr:IPT/TIG domain-containing protein [Candidatus Uhrbacteria bacterium]
MYHAFWRHSRLPYMLAFLTVVGVVSGSSPALAAGRAGIPYNGEPIPTARRRGPTPEVLQKNIATQALRAVFAPEIAKYTGLEAWLVDPANPPLPRAIADLLAYRSTLPSAGVTELTGNIRGNRDMYLTYMGIQAWIDRYAPPVIASLSPDAAGKGDRVTIHGDRFTGVQEIKFGVTVLPKQDYIIASPQEIIVEVPENRSSGVGPYLVPFTIRTATGVATSSTKLTHWTGRCSDANLTRALEELLAITPRGAGTQGQCDATPYGAYASYTDLLMKVAQRYGYTKRESPVIASIAPAIGNPGDRITIRGRNFYQLTDVLFGNHRASFTATSASEIIATVPEEGNGTITIITKSGATSSATPFAFPPVPTITTTAPSQILLTGQLLTLFGAH